MAINTHTCYSTFEKYVKKFATPTSGITAGRWYKLTRKGYAKFLCRYVKGHGAYRMCYLYAKTGFFPGLKGPIPRKELVVGEPCNIYLLHFE